MRELFIYYRLRAIDAEAARAAVRQFQERLRMRHPQLVARLLCRAGEAGDRQTWMETYSTDPQRDRAGIGAALQAEIDAESRVLEPWLDGARHTEVFTACVW